MHEYIACPTPRLNRSMAEFYGKKAVRHMRWSCDDHDPLDAPWHAQVAPIAARMAAHYARLVLES